MNIYIINLSLVDILIKALEYIAFQEKKITKIKLNIYLYHFYAKILLVLVAQYHFANF